MSMRGTTSPSGSMTVSPSLIWSTASRETPNFTLERYHPGPLKETLFRLRRPPQSEERPPPSEWPVSVVTVPGALALCSNCNGIEYDQTTSIANGTLCNGSEYACIDLELTSIVVIMSCLCNLQVSTHQHAVHDTQCMREHIGQARVAADALHRLPRQPYGGAQHTSREERNGCKPRRHLQQHENRAYNRQLGRTCDISVIQQFVACVRVASYYC